MSVEQGLVTAWILGVIVFWGWIIYRILRPNEMMKFILEEIRDYPFSTMIFLFLIVFAWPASVPLAFYIGKRREKNG